MPLDPYSIGNAAPNFTIDTSGTPQDVQRKQALADALLKQGQDSTPAAGGRWGGALTALNRGLAGALGGYQESQARDEAQQGRAHAQQLAAGLLGSDGKVNPQAYVQAANDPWVQPQQLGAVGKVADWQHQTEQDAEHKREWGASFGLQQHADQRATQAAERANMSPLEQAQERAPLLQQYGIDPNSSEGKTFILTGKLPDPNKDVPNSVGEYQYYMKSFKPTPETPVPMDYGTFSTAKARAAATNVTTNVDTKGPDKYDSVIGEGLAKMHGGLMNDVEGAQSRARDIAAMQQSIDAIQKSGGTTGGLGQPQLLDLAKTLNSGAAALGMDSVFDEKNISDKELLAKFNRDMAGAQAKAAVGSRVTNFEMSNYLKANPGLETSITGNQRLLGIKAQIEERNAAVGNAMRSEAARAVGAGQKVNPAVMEKIIRDYDEVHHVKDPVTGQDLTQSYTLPEFQGGGTNKSLATGHDTNMNKIRRYNPETGNIE